MKHYSQGHQTRKGLLFLVIFLLMLCLLLSAILMVLYWKKAPPQRILAKLGIPVQEGTDWSLNSWERSLKQLTYDADIVFIGDSLVIGENFQEYFMDKKILNLGRSGDSLPSIYKRADIISHFTPEMIFVEGGVNSLSGGRIDDLAMIYESMVRELTESNPHAEIYIQSVLPISSNKEQRGLSNKNIIKFNEALKEIAQKYNVVYVDLHSVFSLNGEMNPDYTIDGVHIKDEFKYIWPEVISAYID